MRHFFVQRDYRTSLLSNLNTMSCTISRVPPPISSTASHAACLIYIGETGKSLRTRFGEHRRAVIQATRLASLLPDILIMAITVFQI
jgi:hypothetical protein